eukprot:Colp12_sorted_trinity150504_noHs@3834
MSNPCAGCGKTVYVTEEVKAADVHWHKLCFKCQDPACGITLKLTTFKAHEGKVYCSAHVPKPTHTQVADDVKTQHALHTPKKTAEGLGTAQKGTGEKPSVGADAVGIVHATSAPKPKAEGLGTAHKGASSSN